MKDLIVEFSLVPAHRNLLTLDVESVLHVIETAYGVHAKVPRIVSRVLHVESSRQALQSHLLKVTFFFTGGRGGSILKEERYPLEYLTWKVSAHV